MKLIYNSLFIFLLMLSVHARAGIDLQPGLSGAWILQESGQGLFVNVARVDNMPDMVVTMYAYKNGEQIWLIGSQPFEYGIQELTIPMYITSGTGWATAFSGEDVQVDEWGTISLSFENCNSGLLQFDSNDTDFGMGELSLTRLTGTDGLSCHETDVAQLEAEGLKFMREEEKMARDVYLKFYEDYGTNPFVNVAASEQTHMDAVLNLMNVYDIPDSSTGVEGTFNNPDLQVLYDTLIEMGSANLTSAYLAAALIEETDILDLQVQIDNSESQDIIDVYTNLMCGSRNHLRAFAANYENSSGLQYEVQISELSEAVESILNSDNEQCGAP